ncbi:MoaF N-terminal domain-containing protein [Actinoplanes sp. NPDC051851]|uniref:MoaF N-terminal domain-containing protein n=1 Tax=Actinoplanes sp. NPDC051851 TaxID=3154753 RepID=UPI003445F2EB
MNLEDLPRELDGLTQFAKPPCHELDGERFHLVMDSGFDIDLEFGRAMCVWNGWSAEYHCVKADDDTYLVTFIADPDGVRECHSFVLDLEQRLVTHHTCAAGRNPRHPLLMTDTYDFGAIETEGYALPYRRHCFTGDLLGTQVQWHWTTDLVSRHAYLEPSFYRVTWEEGGRMEETFDEEMSMIPATDELARYIKIKDRMYLFVVTEEKVERLLGDNQPFRSDSMLFIENFDRMFHVGRAFGAMMVGGVPEPLYMIYGAFGKPLELPEKLLSLPNRYTV